MSIIGNPYYFTGRRLDTETGLYYYRARMYSATLGRFMQTDPIGYADGLNVYMYCRNSPVTWTDMYGLCGEARSTWDGWVENAELFGVWALGWAPRETVYGPRSGRTQDLMNWVGSAKARREFNRVEAGEYDAQNPYFYPYDFGLAGFIQSGSNPTGQFVGGGHFKVYPNPDGRTQTVIFDNTTGRSSFFYHIYPEAWNTPSGTVMGNWYQEYLWVEPLHRSGYASPAIESHRDPVTYVERRAGFEF